MTDNSTSQNTSQQVQTPKKDFFGGEINFQDKTAFEALDSIPEEISKPHEESIAYPVQTTTAPAPKEEEVSFEDFDPFGDNQDTTPTNATHQEKVQPNPEESFQSNEIENQEETESKEESSESLVAAKATTAEEHLEQEPEKTGNEIIDTFLELSNTAKKIFQLSEDKTHFKVLGGKNPKTTLEYFVYLVEDENEHTDLFIKKVETDNQNTEEDEHLLQWSYNQEKQSLEIFVDEIILYTINNNNEEENNTSQIIEKLHKFGFLFENHYEDLHKAYLEKKEGEEKKKQLHEIFRGF